MFTRLGFTSLLAILLMTLLFGCATPTQPSADISTQDPHPSPIFNFQVVVKDRVYRSGQPKDEDDWKYLENLGIKTVIKLNQFATIKGMDGGVRDVDITEERNMATKYHIELIEMYMQPEDWPHNWNLWVRPELEIVLGAVKELEKRSNEKILVHCSHGKDRTGLVVAVYSVCNKNFCKEAAFKQMQDYGTSPWLFGLKPVLDRPEIMQTPRCTTEYK